MAAIAADGASVRGSDKEVCIQTARDLTQGDYRRR